MDKFSLPEYETANSSSKIEEYKNSMREYLLNRAKAFSEIIPSSPAFFEKAKEQNFSQDSLLELIERLFHDPLRINMPTPNFCFNDTSFQDDFEAFELFTKHDTQKINLGTQSAIFKEILKDEKAAQVIMNIPHLNKSLFEGIASVFGAKFPLKKTSLNDVVNQFIEPVYYQNEVLGSLEKSFDGLPLNQKIVIHNKIKDETEINICEGPLGLSVHNWIKNTCSLGWEYLSEDSLNGNMATEAQRWQNHLKNSPLTLTIDFHEKNDAYILELYDNGPGPDLTGLQDKIIRLLNKKGVQYFLESDLVQPELKKALKKACQSVYDFYPQIGPYFGDIIKIGRLSGRSEHEGLGLWGMEKMLKSIGASCVIGQGGIGQKLDGNPSQNGTYCAIVLPKEETTLNNYVEKTQEKINGIYA